MGRRLHGRYIQQCGSRCGSHLSGDEQDLKEADARIPTSWCRATAHRAVRQRTWPTASMRTDSAPLSTPPAASSRLTSRKNTPSSAPEHFAEASRQAVMDMIADINSVLLTEASAWHRKKCSSSNLWRVSGKAGREGYLQTCGCDADRRWPAAAQTRPVYRRVHQGRIKDFCRGPSASVRLIRKTGRLRIVYRIAGAGTQRSFPDA